MLNCVSVWVCACVSMRGCVLVCMHLTPHPLHYIWMPPNGICLKMPLPYYGVQAALVLKK